MKRLVLERSPDLTASQSSVCTNDLSRLVEMVFVQYSIHADKNRILYSRFLLIDAQTCVKSCGVLSKAIQTRIKEDFIGIACMYKINYCGINEYKHQCGNYM